MTKTLLIVLLCVAATACGSATSQKNSAQKNANQPVRPPASEAVRNQRIKEQAQEVFEAMIRRDYPRLLDLTYPRVLELMGGREVALAAIEREAKQFQTNGTGLEGATVGEPRDFMQVEKESFAFVPTTMTIKVPEGKLVGETFLLGISSDGGHNWTFISSEAGATNPKMLQSLFPAAADKLRIPEVKQPVLHRNP
jgi:hypothetical protein